MKCLNKEIIFNYLNKQLNEDLKKRIAEHLENCTKCQNKYATVQKNIQLVNENLALLEPDQILEKPFVVPTKEIKRHYQKKIFSISPLLDWKKALAFSTVAICLIFVFFLNKKSKPDYEEIFQHVVSIEKSFMADPKQDIIDNVFYISRYDKEKQQVEIIRASETGETISQDVIPLN